MSTNSLSEIRPSGKIRVLVAEDQEIVRKGLLALLEDVNDIQIVGEAENGREAIDSAKKLDPNVILMDVNMPLLNGLEATHQIRKSHPDIKILVLSVHEDEELVVQILKSGANGYLLKTTSPKELVSAIRTVHDGGAFFSPSVSNIVLNSFGMNISSKPASGTLASLTPREREVLQFIAEGNSHKAAADQMNLSVRTIDTHVQSIMKKLALHDRASLVLFAMEHGLVKSRKI